MRKGGETEGIHPTRSHQQSGPAIIQLGSWQKAPMGSAAVSAWGFTA
jgi:hypothetical protein